MTNEQEQLNAELARKMKVIAERLPEKEFLIFIGKVQGLSSLAEVFDREPHPDCPTDIWTDIVTQMDLVVRDIVDRTYLKAENLPSQMQAPKAEAVPAPTPAFSLPGLNNDNKDYGAN